MLPGRHLACLRDCGRVVAVPVGRRTRYELADERLGHALDDLRTAVVADADDRTRTEADEKGRCCAPAGLTPPPGRESDACGCRPGCDCC